MRFIRGLILTSAVFLFALAAAAHHGVSGQFDTSKSFQATGNITQIKLVNPHAYVYLDATDADGNVTNVRCELLPGSTLKRNGWSEDMFVIGSRVSVKGSADRDDPTTCYMNEITFANGVTATRDTVFSDDGDVEVMDRQIVRPDGKPNIEGNWAMAAEEGRGSGPPQVTLTEAGLAAVADASSDQNPRFNCLPTNIIMDWWFNENVNSIRQSDTEIVLTYGFMDLVRTIYLDGREKPADFVPSRAGFSTGEWVGNSLVVTTTGFDEGWISAPLRDRGGSEPSGDDATDERPERTDSPETSESSEPAEGSERPERSEPSDESGQPERPERPEGSERPERPERPPSPEGSERPERPDGFERPARPQRPPPPEGSERPERPERPPPPEGSERPERPEGPERSEASESPEIAEDSQASDRPERPEGGRGRPQTVKNSTELTVTERFTLNEDGTVLTREYSLVDPLYLVGSIEGSDEVTFTQEAYAPYACEDLTNERTETQEDAEDSILLSLENSFVGTLVSGTMWGYPIILSLHAIGMAIVAGISLMLLIRILGFGVAIPVTAMRPYWRVAVGGFVINLVSGAALFCGGASELFFNWAFWTKLFFVSLSLMLTWRLVHICIARSDEVLPAHRKLAAIAMITWIAAIISGRLIGYMS